MSKFKVGDKVRVLEEPTDPFYSNDGYFKAGDEFTVKEVFPGQETVSLVERGQCWNESRFELVEDVKPAVAPQLPGIPEGFRAVRIGKPKRGEWYINTDGEAEQSKGYESARCYTLLEKIDQPAPVEAVKPEAPVAPAKKVAPVFKVGDKVRLVDNTHYEKFPVGTVAKVRSISSNCVPSEGDLLLFDGALESANGMFAYRFELVTESPYDLVIQDRVPAREGIDFGWWVKQDRFDTFKPCTHEKWEMGPGWSESVGKSYGEYDGKYRLAVMCYRKDLPELPTTEKVLLKEYVVWDDGTPKCFTWSTEDPTVENDVLMHWQYAHPTGNTREVEVPVVKA